MNSGALKIAVVTQIFPVREQPYRGHSVVQTLLRLQRMATVKVYSPQAKYPSWLLPKSRMWAQTDLTYAPEMLDARYFAYPAVPILSRPVNGYVCADRLEPLLRAERPDVILSYWIYPDGYASVRVGRKLGVPVVVKAVGSDLNYASDWISQSLARKVLREADALLTVSAHLRNKVVAMGIPAAKVTSIPNGCDTSVFRPADRSQARRELDIEQDAKLITYVGRYDLAKGLLELVQATAELVESWPKLKVALVGDGPARMALEQAADQLRVRDRILFVPPRKSSQVALWMTAADICTLPSYREGCPNVVLEALSCGRPVVGTTVGGIPEHVNDDCGVLVSPGDASSLGKGLRIALERKWDAHEIARKMQRSWEQVAAETFEICAALVGKDKVELASTPSLSGCGG